MKLPQPEGRWTPFPRPGDLLGAALLLTVVALAVGAWRAWMPESVALLVFLTAVLVDAVAFGFWAGILSAIAAFGTLNFFFVAPHYSFFAARPQDLLTLAAFLIAAALAGLLAGRLREQVDAARGRATVLEILSVATAGLTGAQSREEILILAVRHVAALSPGPALALERTGDRLSLVAAHPPGQVPDAADLQAAEQALTRGRVEFATAEGWSGSHLTFHPVPPGKSAGFVLGHVPVGSEWRDYGYRERAIASVLRQAEAALHRLDLARVAEEERHARESQTLRAALLASLSHDLRTPLATILGSVTTLRDLRRSLPAEAQEDLLNAVEEEAQRLARYVEKLLQMTRLMAGVTAQLHWVDAADCAQAAVARARRAFAGVKITTDLPDLPLVRAEAGLLEQALFSLLENAVRYAPGPIHLSAARREDAVVLTVTDAGPGLPPGMQDWLASPDLTRGPGGVGLGLPICKGIARTLGGRLSAGAATPCGTEMRLSLPLPPDTMA